MLIHKTFTDAGRKAVSLLFPTAISLSSINNNQYPKGLWLAFVLSGMYSERSTFVLNQCLLYWIDFALFMGCVGNLCTELY